MQILLFLKILETSIFQTDRKTENHLTNSHLPMTQMLPFYRFPSALLQINEPNRHSWSLTPTLPFPPALPPHDSPLTAFDVFLLVRIYAQPIDHVILSENLALVLPFSTLIVFASCPLQLYTHLYALGLIRRTSLSCPCTPSMALHVVLGSDIRHSPAADAAGAC